MKQTGLQQRYEVKKTTNPEKVMDCMVLEFDDPLARVGIAAFAQACQEAGYEVLASEIREKLVRSADAEG